MIYTLTFNPALDYIVNITDYREGFVNRTNNEKILPGGKGINVSVVLSNLSVENTALGFVGGFSGNYLISLLEERNINTDFVFIDGGNTRINLKIKSNKETDINAQGPLIKETDVELLLKKMDNIKDGDYLVLAGSVPSSLSDTIYCNITQRLSKKKVNLIIDAERNLLKETLKFKPFLIKPNHHELSDICNEKLSDIDDIINAALSLQKMGARNVFVSMAENGGVFVSENNDVFVSPAPSGNVINSTGAGDSLVAGFLSEYIVSNDYKKAFIKGICSGSASAFSHNLATKDEIENLYQVLLTNNNIS